MTRRSALAATWSGGSTGTSGSSVSARRRLAVLTAATATGRCPARPSAAVSTAPTRPAPMVPTARRAGRSAGGNELMNVPVLGGTGQLPGYPGGRQRLADLAGGDGARALRSAGLLPLTGRPGTQLPHLRAHRHRVGRGDRPPGAPGRRGAGRTPGLHRRRRRRRPRRAARRPGRRGAAAVG